MLPLVLGIYLSLFQLIGTDHQHSDFHYYVANGENAVNRTEFIYQVLILAFSGNGLNSCGGSLISDTFIVTAAHCVTSKAFAYIQFGIIAFNIKVPLPLNIDDRIIESSEFFIHPNYTDFLSSDIALLRLNKRVKLSETIQPIRLPSSKLRVENLIGKKTIASGWGETEKFNHAMILQWTELEIQKNCLENKICTDSRDGRTICKGDSGGPLIITESDGIRTLIGITNAANRNGCGIRSNIPSVFVDVSIYLNWISNITGIQVRN